MKNVEIYSTPTCSYCNMTKAFFEENNIQYKEYNVASDLEKRKEMVEKTGQMGVPVTVIEGEAIVGFDKSKLMQALGL